MSGFANSGRVNRVIAGPGFRVDESNPSSPVLRKAEGVGVFEVRRTTPLYVRQPGQGSPAPFQYAPFIWDDVYKAIPGFTLSGGIIHVGEELDNVRAVVEVQVANAGTPLPMEYSTESGVFYPVQELSTRGSVLVTSTVDEYTRHVVATTSGAGQEVRTAESQEIVLKKGKRFGTFWYVPVPPTLPDHGLGGNLSFLRITIY